MMAFRALVGKEFRALLVHTVFGALLIVAVDLFLFSRIGPWGDQVPFGLSTVLVQAVFGWAVIAGWISLHNEWNRGAVHWLLAYPLSGWSKVTAKLAAGVVNTILFLLLAVAGMTWILTHTFGAELTSQWSLAVQVPGFYRLMGANALWMLPIGLLSLANIYLHGHMSYAVGQTVHKARRLVSGVVFFGLPMLGGYLVARLKPLLAQVPLASFYIPEFGQGGIAHMADLPTPFPAVLLVLALVFTVLFVVSGWLLERRAEV